jgi:cGMP-dependent protein kinase
MGTLRELQLALREKIEELRQRDELLDELEQELDEKDELIKCLQVELDKYKSILSSPSLKAYHRPVNHGVQFKERTKKTAISAESGGFRASQDTHHNLYKVAKSQM